MMVRDIAMANFILSTVLAAWSVIDLCRHPPYMTVMK